MGCQRRGGSRLDEPPDVQACRCRTRAGTGDAALDRTSHSRPEHVYDHSVAPAGRVQENPSRVLLFLAADVLILSSRRPSRSGAREHRTTSPGGLSASRAGTHLSRSWGSGALSGRLDSAGNHDRALYVLAVHMQPAAPCGYYRIRLALSAEYLAILPWRVHLILPL